jgi:hypothetical protein
MEVSVRDPEERGMSRTPRSIILMRWLTLANDVMGVDI